MNRPCPEYRDAIADLISGTLPDPQVGAVSQHLSVCSACRDFHETLQAEDGRLVGFFESMNGRMPARKERVMAAINASAPADRATVIPMGHSRIFRRIIQLVAAAAAIAVVTLGARSFLPSRSQSATQRTQWWLDPSMAWAQEVTSALEKMRAVVYREQRILVRRFGSTHVSGNWAKCYEAPGLSRRDTYHNQTLVGIEWSAPDADGTELRHSVSMEHQCYTITHYSHQRDQREPTAALRFEVGLLSKADRLLGTETFDGHECVGFEVSAAKRGDNPKEWVDRIWFDVETKLPVRIERHGHSVTNAPAETLTTVHDQFQYYVEVPMDLFKPRIPDGFVNAHPDEIRKAKEEKEKGRMPQADVPPEWKRDIFAALGKVTTVAYREGSEKTTVSRDAWRRDAYGSDNQPQKTTWCVIEKQDMSDTSLDVTDKGFRLIETVVRPSQKTYTRTVYTNQPNRPGNPMDRLLFQAGLVDRADRILPNAQIDGAECFGVEVSAKKYGTNPDGMLRRLWFDVRTKLPVRMEFECPSSDGPQKVTVVQDHFEWNADLPADTFEPGIPEGFVEVSGQ